MKISRIGKNYITVHDPESGDKLRLKGGIYAEQFILTDRETAGQNREGTTEYRSPVAGELSRLAAAFASVIERRAGYNRKRYPRKPYADGAEYQLSLPDYGERVQPPYRLALLWSFASLTVSVLTIWGLLILSQYRIKALEQEISSLSIRREQLETQNAALWNSFKGLEPYQAEGRSYLLTPAGQQIVNAGKVGQRDAWEVVRR